MMQLSTVDEKLRFLLFAASFTIELNWINLSIHRHWTRRMIGTVFRLLLAFFLLLSFLPLFVVVLALLVLLLMRITGLLARRQVLRYVILIFVLLVFLLVFTRGCCIEDAILFGKLQRVNINLKSLLIELKALTGTFGCKRKPESWTLVSGTNSLPPIGGLSITLRSELLSYNVRNESVINRKIQQQKKNLTMTPGPSMTQGKVGKKDESCSLTFLLLNFEYVCSRP